MAWYQSLFHTPGTNDGPIQKSMMNQLDPMLCFMESRWRGLKRTLSGEQGPMQAVGTDPQEPFHEAVSSAGQAQHVQAGIPAMSTRP